MCLLVKLSCLAHQEVIIHADFGETGSTQFSPFSSLQLYRRCLRSEIRSLNISTVCTMTKNCKFGTGTGTSAAKLYCGAWSYGFQNAGYYRVSQ
jgi:hypothetical protein